MYFFRKQLYSVGKKYKIEELSLVVADFWTHCIIHDYGKNAEFVNSCDIELLLPYILHGHRLD